MNPPRTPHGESPPFCRVCGSRENEACPYHTLKNGCPHGVPMVSAPRHDRQTGYLGPERRVIDHGPQGGRELRKSKEQFATYGETPDEWYEREKTAFRAWWESDDNEKTFSSTPTMAAGAGWFARAEAAPETAPSDACRAALANIMARIDGDEFVPTEYKEDAKKALASFPSATPCSGWISVTERLPKDLDIVWGWYPGMDEPVLDKGWRIRIWGEPGDQITGAVWQPAQIPEAPRG